MYDLTALLTTIAACSASIVAILGGFIAGKLIALNADREEIEMQLAEMNEEISFYTKERDAWQEKLDEDDALNFIRDNIESLVNEEAIDEAYRAEAHPLIEKEKLKPYWDAARDIAQEIDEYRRRTEDYIVEKNDDGVPVAVAQKMTAYFDYQVCKRVCYYLDVQESPAAALRYGLGGEVSAGNWYAELQEKISVNNSKIDLLMLQKKQRETRCEALKRPKGMKAGLLRFMRFLIALVDYFLAFLLRFGYNKSKEFPTF